VTVLVGTNYYAATGHAGRRQGRAIRALRTVPGVHAVNLQWPDDIFEVEAITTLPVLRQDSRTVSGRRGPRKPIVNEMLDELARAAAGRGCEYFVYTNSDIEITPAAIAVIETMRRRGLGFTRTELDPATGVRLGTMRFGIDAFAFDVDWWYAHRHRFRAYIAGEPVWDNVYLAVLLSHSDGALIDEEGMLLHEQHASPWKTSPFSDYTWFLAALDRPYFAQWARFHTEWTRRPMAAADVCTLREQIFTVAQLRRGRVIQWGRVLKAWFRYAAQLRHRQS
jgi:hypothetical protein